MSNTHRSNGNLTRRSIMASATGAAAAAILGNNATVLAADDKPIKNNRINQSVSAWCYGRLSLDQLCQEAVKIGIKAIDLLNPDAFPTLKKYGLACGIVNCIPIDPGLNRKENHGKYIAAMKKTIEVTSEAGFPNVICMSGNRKGMPDDEGAKNCAEAIKQVVGFAEQKKVTLCMELLNSKRDHKDYMCDHTEWGVGVCKAVGSERFKLLYDIYHMQIMEGDVIATIKQYHQYIGHYHTGGVPGRNEIDETQELYYPAIMNAIVATGYKGYVAHEFIPKGKDPIASLAAAARLCDV